MNFIKKKVSFDIDPKILSDVKSFCEVNNRKLSDFFRDAVNEKIARVQDYITIYIVANKGIIEKYTIPLDTPGLEIFEASQEMRENVGAYNQGIIPIRNNFKNLSSKLQSRAIDGTIYFFTKDKYLREKINKIEEQ